MYEVFVYGTLKRGFPNYEVGMVDAQFICRARSVDAFPLVIGGRWFTPYLIDEQGSGHRVFGDLFRVTAERLDFLDSFESVHLPNGYKRREIEVETESGNLTQTAWAYLKDREAIEGIQSSPMEEYPLDPRYVVPGDPRRNE